MAERTHRWPIRVYYEDTDAAGIVYHAQYICFCERARTEFLRALGLDHRRLLAEHGLLFAVRRVGLDLMRPARLDDRLEVVTSVEACRGARLTARQRIEREGDLVADARIELATVSPEMRPRRVPPVLADLFGAWV